MRRLGLSSSLETVAILIEFFHVKGAIIGFLFVRHDGLCGPKDLKGSRRDDTGATSPSYLLLRWQCEIQELRVRVASDGETESKKGTDASDKASNAKLSQQTKRVECSVAKMDLFEKMRQGFNNNDEEKMNGGSTTWA